VSLYYPESFFLFPFSSHHIMATSGCGSCLLGACLLVGLFDVAEGVSAFRTPAPLLQAMRAEELRATMLDELMSGLGDGNRVTKDRLANLEEAIRPIFLSLPKNTDGNLDHATVRYLLHRIFVLRHGMFIKGLHPAEEANVSATVVLSDRVPSYVQTLFEDKLQGHGLGLHEVSMLAATMEHLVFDENVKRLRMAYDAYGHEEDDAISESDAGDLVELYMALFAMGHESANINPKRVIRRVSQVYPLWKATREFAAEVLKEFVVKRGIDSSEMPFSFMASVVEEIGERFGRWQDHDCLDIKSKLLKSENAGTGRVLLSDFYALGKGFTESKTYLQKTGALDETDATRPHVIVPNYVNDPANCIASSGMFSVCCLNECENLFGHLEREVKMPDATPDRILEIVAALPSATVQAPRVLSETLRSRLQEISTHHGAGLVPLHGRLFTQWMHFAYPRECPYPHRAGTERSQESPGIESEESMFYMDALSSPSEDAAVVAKEGISMWSAEEELLVDRKVSPVSSGRHVLRTIAFLAAVVSVCVTLSRQAVAAFGQLEKTSMLPFAHKDHYC